MAVLFVVYMPNEDREASEDGDPVSPAPLILPKVATVDGSNKLRLSDNSDREKEDTGPKILIDVGDADEFSPKKPLLGNACGDMGDQTSSTSSDKPADDDKRVTKHQSLLTLDKPIPRRSSENVLTKPEDAESDMHAVSDNVVYKGNKVRFQVTKLDTPNTERAKQPVAEAASSAVEPTAETDDEKKESVILDQEADVVMERLTLKEVATPLRRCFPY